MQLLSPRVSPYGGSIVRFLQDDCLLSSWVFGFLVMFFFGSMVVPLSPYLQIKRVYAFSIWIVCVVLCERCCFRISRLEYGQMDDV